LRGVENVEMEITGSPGSELEQRQPYRPKLIGPLEILHIHRGILWLDSEKVDRVVKYMEIKRPDLAVGIKFSILFSDIDFE
jgi:hypothetical protein